MCPHSSLSDCNIFVLHRIRMLSTNFQPSENAPGVPELKLMTVPLLFNTKMQSILKIRAEKPLHVFAWTNIFREIHCAQKNI